MKNNIQFVETKMKKDFKSTLIFMIEQYNLEVVYVAGNQDNKNVYSIMYIPNKVHNIKSNEVSFRIKIKNSIYKELIEKMYAKMTIDEIRDCESMNNAYLEEDAYVYYFTDYFLFLRIIKKYEKIYTLAFEEMFEKYYNNFISLQKYKDFLKNFEDCYQNDKDILLKCIPSTIKKTETFDGLSLSNKEKNALAECILYLARLNNIEITIKEKESKE